MVFLIMFHHFSSFLPRSFNTVNTAIVFLKKLCERYGFARHDDSVSFWRFLVLYPHMGYRYGWMKMTTSRQRHMNDVWQGELHHNHLISSW